MNDPRVTYEKQQAKPKPKASKAYFIITFAIAFALAFYFSWKIVFRSETPDKAPVTFQQP